VPEDEDELELEDEVILESPSVIFFVF